MDGVADSFAGAVAGVAARGYEYVPYISLESIIEDNKDAYYQALRQTQKILREAEQTDWAV